MQLVAFIWEEQKIILELTKIDNQIDVHCLKYYLVYALFFLPFAFLPSCIMQKP